MVDIVDRYSEILNIKYPGMISVPPGWKHLVDALLDELLLQNNLGYPCKVYQIKEKWGELRIGLVSHFVDHYRPLISLAERMSKHICQISGAPGTLRDINGWLMVLSDEEYDKKVGNNVVFDVPCSIC